MKTVKLGDVADIKGGGTPATNREDYFGGSLPWFTPTEIVTGKISFLVDSVRTLTDEGSMFTAVAEPGSVLLTCRAGIGKVGILENRAGFNQGIKSITPHKDQLDSMYLAYWLISHKELLEQNASGTTFLEISTTNVRNLEIPYPPIEEQKKIVERLDGAFEKIDRAIELTQKNIQNSQNLFLNSLEEIFGKSSDYPKKKLSEISEYFNGLTYSPKDVVDNGTVVLRSSNIQDDVLAFSDIVRVNAKIPDKKYVRDGDVLICSRNGSKRLIGKTAVIKNLAEPMTFGAFMMIIRSEYNPYLIWFFKSNAFKRQMASGENTSINQITRYMLDEVTVPFPDLQSHGEISLKMHEIWDKSRKLSVLYQVKLNKLEALKKSMLEEAFRGSSEV